MLIIEFVVNCGSFSGSGTTLELSTEYVGYKEVDLHGYDAAAALKKVADYLDDQKFPGIIFITGIGLHSVDQQSTVRPAVIDDLKNRGCGYHPDPVNDGRMIVHLQKRPNNEIE